MSRIEIEKRGPIGEIRLNRPEVLNAMGGDWPADMLSAAAEMNDDPEIRVVLVTSAGRAFCSGLDLTDLVDGEISARWFHEAELAYRALETMNKPVIAGIQGPCLGGGVQIAIACDVRIAADDAIIGLVNCVVARSRLERELEEWANRYKDVPASTLKWVKHLTNQAFDLPFEAFLEEMDKAMQVVLVSEEHLAAREAWRQRRQRRQQGK
jgi:enoyl-CoA hydratase/carnithine racemase